MQHLVRAGAHALVHTLALISLVASAQAGHSIQSMLGWATSVEALERGPMDIMNPGGGLASWGNESFVLGAALGDTLSVLSLGDHGTITLGFELRIFNGPGDDFAVFENGIWSEEGFFGEFAFVEVSSNGFDYAAFPPISWHATPVPSGGVIDPADFQDFAGDEPAGQGTGFDLALLASDPLVQSGAVDILDIGYVRLTDVIGDGTTLDANLDPIYDPYPTNYPTGGFDLDGVGVLYDYAQVPEPEATATLLAGMLLLVGLARTSRRSRAERPRSLALAGLATVALLTAGATRVEAGTVDFEDLGLSAESFWNGDDASGGFNSGGVDFQNSYIEAWLYWYGFAHSTMTDTTTEGFTNQYSAYTASGGGGVAGSSTYGLFFDDSFNDPHLVLDTTELVAGFYITNTTYSYLSMSLGDAVAKRFGGDDGTDADWFRLTIYGYDDLGGSTGSVDFYLADFRFEDDSLDYIVDSWRYVDLTTLGAVKELGFELSSSDVTAGFLNTPGYFAMDSLRVVPEPGSGLLVGLGLSVLGLRRRK
jgi:hypothetical protein